MRSWVRRVIFAACVWTFFEPLLVTYVADAFSSMVAFETAGLATLHFSSVLWRSDFFDRVASLSFVIEDLHGCDFVDQSFTHTCCICR